LKYQLGLFEQYLADRSKFFPHEITTDDVVHFRALPLDRIGTSLSPSCTMPRRRVQCRPKGTSTSDLF
jgi:hypothetical protein